MTAISRMRLPARRPPSPARPGRATGDPGPSDSGDAAGDANRAIPAGKDAAEPTVMIEDEPLSGDDEASLWFG